MLREKFLETLDEYAGENITVVTYYVDEMYGRKTIAVITVEDYDDEIVIRGEGTDFVVLNCKHINMNTEEENEIEFLFTVDNFTTAVEFLS